MTSYDLLSHLKDDSALLDDLRDYVKMSPAPEPIMPPFNWPKQLQDQFDELVATQGTAFAFLKANSLLEPEEEEDGSEYDSGGSDDESVGAEEDDGSFTRLDFYYSKASSDKVRDFMLRVAEMGFDGNDLKEILTQLTPIYAAYKGAVPSTPKMMTRVQISNYRDEITTETTEIGPYYLRKLIEDEAFPGSVECRAGDVAQVVIAGAKFAWNNSEAGETRGERAELAAVLSRHHDKSKQIVFCNCEGLGRAHSILVNTFMIKREGVGFTVTERTLMKGTDGYQGVRLLEGYQAWHDYLNEVAVRTKDAWEFHNLVQIYIFKNRKGVTKPLLDYVLTAENDANIAAEARLRSLDGIMSRGVNLPQLAQMQNQLNASKREGRNFGANKQLFRANASLYGKGFNSLADHAEHVALARTILSLGIKSVVVGCAQNEGKRMNRAFQAEKLATENYDAATNSWHQLTSVDLTGKAVLCASYLPLMSVKKTTHPSCLENVIRVANAGASAIITTWKTEEFISRTSLLNQEWFGLVPTRFNKFQFLKAGKGHTTHFYLFMWQGPHDKNDIPFSKFILSAMQQTVRMAYVLEQFTAAGCRYGVKPDMARAVPLVQKLITERINGEAKPVVLDRNVTFRLNSRTVQFHFDPKAAGPADETIEPVDNKDSKYLESSAPTGPTEEEIEKIAKDSAEEEDITDYKPSSSQPAPLPSLSSDVKASEAAALAKKRAAEEERRQARVHAQRIEKEAAEKEAAESRAREVQAAKDLLSRQAPPAKPERPPAKAPPKVAASQPSASSSSSMSLADQEELARFRANAKAGPRSRAAPPRGNNGPGSRFSFSAPKK